VGLQELYAHNNELTYVPASIETCSNLHTLTFSNNLLSELPYGVGYLTNLTHLSVKNNHISVLSPGLSQNVLLVQFELDDNPIKDPPLLVLQQGFKAVMAYLQRMFDVKTTGHVDLRDLELKDMPADLLGVLGAGDTKTGSRPSTAGSKKGRKTKGPAPIQKLSLTGNKLEYLPAFVGELSSLRELKMDDDLIEPPLHIRNEGISMMQGYLRRIVTAKAQLNLDLRGMLLKEVKLQYYKLESLTSCDLGSNLLTAVPDEVFRYTDLSWLDLSNNLLTQLPRELEVLADLRQIDARGNQIEHVPAEIFERSALCTLMLANNRIYALGGPAPAHLRARARGVFTISDEGEERESGEDVDAYPQFQKLYKDSFGSKQGHGNGSNGGGNPADVGGGGGAGWGWGELDLGSLQNLAMSDNQLETIPQLAGSAV
jgi:Leucine-rich repeat (LRR) protein